MNYFAEPNLIEYDQWFDQNINPVDLINYSDKNKFCNFTHKILHEISSLNSFIGSLKAILIDI